MPVERLSRTTTALKVPDAYVPRLSEPPRPDASTASHERPSAVAGVTEYTLKPSPVIVAFTSAVPAWMLIAESCTAMRSAAIGAVPESPSSFSITDSSVTA